jgi:hypothetical protein
MPDHDNGLDIPRRQPREATPDEGRADAFALIGRQHRHRRKRHSLDLAAIHFDSETAEQDMAGDRRAINRDEREHTKAITTQGFDDPRLVFAFERQPVERQHLLTLLRFFRCDRDHHLSV